MGGWSDGEEKRIGILTSRNFSEQWRKAFFETVQKQEYAVPLKEAALKEKLKDWTEALTRAVVSTCENMGWKATAKGHRLELLPIPGSEYLSLDVMAFPEGKKRWRFPVAVVELENSKEDDRIAYSLWKVLCVQSKLRVVFCYRKESEQASVLIRFLRDDVIHAMDVSTRVHLEGETLVVVGSRAESSTFPYGFFKWWQMDKNTGTFRVV